PCAGSFGRSSSTSAPAISPICAASRSTALARNGLLRAEQVLERAELLGGSCGDQHVAVVQPHLRVRRRVEGAVALAEGDDERARVLADVQLEERLARGAAPVGAP